MTSHSILEAPSLQELDLEKLWNLAEEFGVPEIERVLGGNEYRASIRLPDGSLVRGVKAHNPRITLLDAIHGAKKLTERGNILCHV